MNNILKMIVAAIFAVLCQTPYASAKTTADSPAVRTLETCRDARTYEGAMLKLAKPPKPDDTADALAIAICHAHSGASRLAQYYNK